MRVLVVGATNRLKALDPALLRGGRLSRRIEIPLPDVEQRRDILAVLTERMPLVAVDLDDLALETEGFSGGDLKALCQQPPVAEPAVGQQHRLDMWRQQACSLVEQLLDLVPVRAVQPT